MLDGWFVGNSNALLDVGVLHEKIANYQIEEMKTIPSPSFIRINRGLYTDGSNQNGHQVVNRIETRYIVLPSDEDIEKFPELEVKELNELRKDYDLLSHKIVLGITGENGEQMESFVSMLKSFNNTNSPKK